MQHLNGFVLKRDGIDVIKCQGGVLDTVVFENQSFHLKVPGIYTIEGPNQGGKSLLVKLIMGAPPRGLTGETKHGTLRLYGEPIPVSVKNVQEAQLHGMVAVFQDETLIPSMTIAEQLFMRHAQPTWKTFITKACGMIYKKVVSIAEPFTDKQVEELLKFLKPSEDLSPASEVLCKAKDLLRAFQWPEDILYRVPSELSGGAKAVARLVSALLVPKIKILFLDEAFNAVDRKTWPFLIERLREWQNDHKVQTQRTIVAISHNREEILRWQPTRQFCIVDGKIQERGIRGYVSLHAPIPSRVSSIPVFIYPYTNCQIPKYQGQSFIITSKVISNRYSRELMDVQSILKTISGIDPIILAVEKSDESIKTLENYSNTVKSILEKSTSTQRPGACAVVGGGALHNMAAFACGTVFRGKAPLLIVPTTLTAVADVAIGSKTSINFKTSVGVFKNAVGVYVNPTAILLDKRFLTGLPEAEKCRGLTECLKHGLLQSEELFKESANLMKQDAPNIDSAFNISCRVLEIKSSILSKYPWETGSGRILRFGHFFAHALERTSSFEIHHSSSVLWGMLIELCLGGEESKQVYHSLLDTIRHIKFIDRNEWIKYDTKCILESLSFDPYDDSDGYEVIIIQEIGCYGNPPLPQLNTRKAALAEIPNAMEKVAIDIT